MKNHAPIDIDVNVEIYPGLVLEGHIRCKASYDPHGCDDGRDAYEITDHQLTANDKDGAAVTVDWDDLSEAAQTKIEDQVIEYYSQPAEAA